MTAAPTPGLHLDLSTTLERVALAMQILANMIVEVETNILENIQETGQNAPVPLSVQKLDHALQMIDEIGLLMQRLSGGQLSKAQCDFDQMITPIRLEGLLNLIVHGEAQTEQVVPTGKTGHVSLF